METSRHFEDFNSFQIFLEAGTAVLVTFIDFFHCGKSAAIQIPCTSSEPLISLDLCIMQVYCFVVFFYCFLSQSFEVTRGTWCLLPLAKKCNDHLIQVEQDKSMDGCKKDFFKGR